jgi:hypothetical protein
MGPREAGTGCPLEGWKAADNNRCTFHLHTVSWSKSLLQIVCKHFIQVIEMQKCMRAFSNTYIYTYIYPLTLPQIRLVRGMSEQRRLPVPTRAAARVCAQVAEEGR